jgi:hypothetical protein
MRGSFKKGLLSLVGRMFGAPKGRHVVGASSPAFFPAPTASSTPAVGPGPQLESVSPAAAPGVATEPISPGIATVDKAPLQTASAELATIRLIFADGSVVALSEASLEGRRAHSLARRVLEAGRHP